MAKIDGVELTDEHIGEQVSYHIVGLDPDYGTISSFDDDWVWVKFLAPNGERCHPTGLHWNH